MKIQRRDLFKAAIGMAAGGVTILNPLFAEEDKPNPKSNKFLIYVHFASGCGVSNGLIQPMKVGEWQKGFFYSGQNSGGPNSNFNRHTAAGALIFHDYFKFLKDMADDMCLVNGDPQSLDHNVASVYQKRGTAVSSFAPEWAMGVAQFMQTEANANPMCITEGSKTSSVPDITPLSAGSIADFEKVTRDQSEVPGKSQQAIWDTFSKRFKTAKLSSIDIESSLGTTMENQVKILLNGLPQLQSIKSDLDNLANMMSDAEVLKLIAASGLRDDISRSVKSDFRDSLILAGGLAKTGLASGMSLGINMGDLHIGGSCIETPRLASAAWAQMMQFWKWIRAMKLQDDVMIVVGQEFARSAFSGQKKSAKYINHEGKEITFDSMGRDHAQCMGTMFINGKVPKAARIGNVTDNFIAAAGIDLKGGISNDKSTPAYTSENIVGSMLMRAFDDIFPTERMVRKHWPSFVEIKHILDA